MCAYLMTASFEAPLTSRYTNIYVYLTARLLKRHGKKIPDFAMEQLTRGLSQDEERELRHLRNTIYQKRGGDIDTPVLNAMRKLKNSGSEKQATEQPSLFDSGSGNNPAWDITGKAVTEGSIGTSCNQ
jgi:hypothetical protein